MTATSSLVACNAGKVTEINQLDDAEDYFVLCRFVVDRSSIINNTDRNSRELICGELVSY